MSKKTDAIKPINATFDEVVGKVAPPISSKNNAVGGILPDKRAPSHQYPMDIGIQVQKAVNGVEMGVLDNGIPYLTQSGLAKMTGASRKAIFEISKEWEEKIDEPIIGKARNSFLKDYLFKSGFTDSPLFIETIQDGSVHYAYPDIVCMAILEYYAFEAQKPYETAINNFRNLSRFGLQKFIYEALNYVPEDKWKYFNDRVSILKDSSPDGHFILFKETTGLAVDLINADLTVNHKTIPDISVGIAWGKFWQANKLDKKYGPRQRYEHNYPDYYPQSASNPQTPWAYPDEALPLFRRWFKSEYLLTKFPKYILTKANVLRGGKLEAEQIAALFDQKLIGG